MLRILVLSLLVCACGEVGAVEESHQGGLGTAAAVPPPSPECTSGYSSITAHQAAKNIAEQYCISLGQDYDTLCMAPVVARYCPDIAACQVNLCLDQMETLGACMQIFPPSPDCHDIFPTARAAVTRHVTVPAAGAQANGDEAWFDRTRWQIPTAGAVYYPVPIETGCTLTRWAVSVFRPTATTGIGASLLAVTPTGVTSHVGGATVEPDGATSGFVTLSNPSLAYAASAGIGLYLELYADSISGASHVYGAEFDFACSR